MTNEPKKVSARFEWQAGDIEIVSRASDVKEEDKPAAKPDRFTWSDDDVTILEEDKGDDSKPEASA